MVTKKANPKVAVRNRGNGKGEIVKGEIVDLGERAAPLDRRVEKKEIITPVFNDAQLNIILGRTPNYAIKKRVGPGGKPLSYVPHGYVTDQLNKAFGFDWDLILNQTSNGSMYSLEIENIYKREGNKITNEVVGQMRHVVVTGQLVIRIHKPGSPVVVATITKSGFGSQQWLPSMELGDALKGARSDLLKTCAYLLGIALDLYWDDAAEFQEYQRRMTEKERADFEAQAMAELLAKDKAPGNVVLLISRAAQEFNMDLDDICLSAKVTEDQLMALESGAIAAVWDKLKKVGRLDKEDEE